MNEKEQRYFCSTLDNNNLKDLAEWMFDGVLAGIVDDANGGIIGYVNIKHVDEVIHRLNEGKK